MTISAQVIDTIVEWIDDNLHQPLRIDDIARHAGYSKWHLQRLFLQYKGRAWGAIFAKGSCCWPPAICVTPISGYDICPKYGRFATDLYPRLHPDLQSAAVGAYRKENHSRAHWARPSWFSVRSENQRRHTQRSTRYSMAPSSNT